MTKEERVEEIVKQLRQAITGSTGRNVSMHVEGNLRKAAELIVYAEDKPDASLARTEELEPELCGIPSRNVGTCDLSWGHDGNMHANGGDGFYARAYEAEHARRQAFRLERDKTKEPSGRNGPWVVGRILPGRLTRFSNGPGDIAVTGELSLAKRFHTLKEAEEELEQWDANARIWSLDEAAEEMIRQRDKDGQ